MRTAVPSELRVEELSRNYGDFRLVADFSVAAGERAGLAGPSGSGKTTLLRLIAGLDRPDRGSIRLGGVELSGLAPHRREIGVVFQDPTLFPSMDLLENAAFGLRMRGMAQEEREAQVMPWLEKLGLAHRAHAPVGQLSGGEAQRVAFIRALVWKPRLLLLDEPFSALDRELRKTLRRELLELHAEDPVPLLVVSHDSEDLEALATFELRLEVQGSTRAVRRK